MPFTPELHRVVVHDDDHWDLEDWIGILMILGMCIRILVGIYT